MKKALAAFLCIAFLAGCSSDAPPPVQLANVQPSRIVLDVASVSIVDHSGFQPSDSPYNSYNLEPTIVQSVRKWAGETLQANGMSGQVLVIIQDASLKARALPMSSSLTDQWFKRQQASEYLAHVSVQVEIEGHNGSFAFASAEASRNISLPENPTIAERKDAYTTLLNELMKEFRPAIDASVREHMHGYIRN